MTKPGKQKKASKKVKREVANVLNREERVRRKLLMMNPYARTLLDPFNIKGIKIPDDALYPSVPFQIVDRRTLVANAQGVAALCYGFRSVTLTALSRGSLIPIGINGDTTGSFVAGFIAGSAATTADLTTGTLNTNGPNDIRFLEWSAASPTIQNAFDKVRLVSAGLNVQCTSNFSSNSGKYTAVFAPRNYSRFIGGTAIPITYLQNMPDSITVPISLEKGVTITYSPCDEYCNSYAQVGSNQSGTNFTLPTPADATFWENWRQYTPGEFWCAIDGAPANATFQCTFVANYEAIPSQNNFLLDSASSTSKSDPIALAHALKVRDEVPTAIASSAEANGVAFDLSNKMENGLSMTHTSTGASGGEPMMFDSLLNVLAGAGNLVDKVSNIGSKLSPLINLGLAAI